jgi:hypothetical protein
MKFICVPHIATNDLHLLKYVVPHIAVTDLHQLKYGMPHVVATELLVLKSRCLQAQKADSMSCPYQCVV